MEQKLTIKLYTDSAYHADIDRDMVEMCGLLRDMINEDEVCEFPLDVIRPKTMDRVVEFLKQHATNPMKKITKPITTDKIVDIVGEWDANFIALEDDQETLMDIIIAANYMDCASLLELGILKIACMIKDKEPKEVQAIFNIDGDITPEEEKAVRDAHPWVFELGTKDEDTEDEEDEEDEEEEED